MLVVNCKSRQAASVEENELAKRYFTEIRRTKVLTDQEQRALLTIVKNGKPGDAEKARNKLMTSNQRFVASAARHMSNGDNFTDLISEGTIGLAKAIEKFDLSYPQRFLTYAVFWINKYMTDYLVNIQPMVKPKNATKVHAYVASAINEFFLKNCRKPTLEELEDQLTEKGVEFSNKDDLADIIYYSLEDINPEFDETLNIGVYNDFVGLTSSDNITDKIDKDHAVYLAEKIISQLNERQQFIIRSYYGIGRPQETIDMIASILNVEKRSVQRELESTIKFIQKKIINKSKKIRHGKN